MTPAHPASRLPLLGCALVAGALSLVGCGGGDARPAGRGQQPCPPAVGDLVGSLRALRRQLAVGLSYEQYAARVDGLRASYDRVPVERLTIACLAETGTPAETALNRYIDGANAWGECLADAACTTASIEPVLQRKWRVASHFVSAAG